MHAASIMHFLLDRILGASESGNALIECKKTVVFAKDLGKPEWAHRLNRTHHPDVQRSIDLDFVKILMRTDGAYNIMTSRLQSQGGKITVDSFEKAARLVLQKIPHISTSDWQRATSGFIKSTMGDMCKYVELLAGEYYRREAEKEKPAFSLEADFSWATNSLVSSFRNHFYNLSQESPDLVDSALDRLNKIDCAQHVRASYHAQIWGHTVFAPPDRYFKKPVSNSEIRLALSAR